MSSVLVCDKADAVFLKSAVTVLGASFHSVNADAFLSQTAGIHWPYRGFGNAVSVDIAEGRV